MEKKIVSFFFNRFPFFSFHTSIIFFFLWDTFVANLFVANLCERLELWLFPRSFCSYIIFLIKYTAERCVPWRYVCTSLEYCFYFHLSVVRVIRDAEKKSKNISTDMTVPSFPKILTKRGADEHFYTDIENKGKTWKFSPEIITTPVTTPGYLKRREGEKQAERKRQKEKVNISHNYYKSKLKCRRKLVTFFFQKLRKHLLFITEEYESCL